MKNNKLGLGFPANIKSNVVELRKDTNISVFAIEFQPASTRSEDINEIAFRVVKESTNEKNLRKSPRKIKAV